MRGALILLQTHRIVRVTPQYRVVLNEASRVSAPVQHWSSTLRFVVLQCPPRAVNRLTLISIPAEHFNRSVESLLAATDPEVDEMLARLQHGCQPAEEDVIVMHQTRPRHLDHVRSVPYLNRCHFPDFHSACA